MENYVANRPESQQREWHPSPGEIWTNRSLEQAFGFTDGQRVAFTQSAPVRAAITAVEGWMDGRRQLPRVNLLTDDPSPTLAVSFIPYTTISRTLDGVIN